MHVFLDLDGTLTDPAEGITRSLAYALERLGKPVEDPRQICHVIGPPLRPTFRSMGVDPEQALTLYRERYTSRGLFENRVYDGIETALALMRESGHALHLMTAKPHVYARRITRHFGLADYLTHEFGSELDGTRDRKADLLEYALTLTDIRADDAVMIGDRVHDFEAARMNAMRSIAVTWGFGPEDEIRQADYRVASPLDMARLVSDIA